MSPTSQRRTLAATGTALGLAAALAGCAGMAVPAPAGTEDAALRFDATRYTTVQVRVDGAPVQVRQYRIVYVAKPLRMALTQPTLMGKPTTLSSPHDYQTMVVSVPEHLLGDRKAALYTVVNNGGWWASPVATPITDGASFASTSDTDAIGAALKAGHVVIHLGTRSRGIRTEDGRWAGKAPAPVVDVKAAIRYLRLNDGAMPGSAERIIVTGTSGGGGLTAVVAASGNSTDYLPELAEIGAAGVRGSGAAATSTLRDDIFAAVAYCPINNLGHADAGYEWEYGALRDDTNTPALNGVAYAAGPQPGASTALAALFPAYLNGLGLTRDDGSALTAAHLRDLTLAQVKAELERQIAKGTAIPALGESFTLTLYGPPGSAPTTKTIVNDWLTLAGQGTRAQVAHIDYARFLRFVTATARLKTVVAFDAAGVTGNPNVSGESNLFGSDHATYANFNAWTWAHNTVKGDGSGLDDTGQDWDAHLADPSNGLARQLRLINPVAYLNTPTADAAPYWYVRHGMIDRDTSFAMQTLLYRAIRQDPSVKDVNFKLHYLVPHAGNYDVQEAFAWMRARLDAHVTR
jgi:hypothetical protein